MTNFSGPENVDLTKGHSMAEMIRKSRKELKPAAASSPDTTFPAPPHWAGRFVRELAPARPATRESRRISPSRVAHDGYAEPRLTATEFRRRLCHMLPGLLPLILWYVPHKDPLAPLLRSIIFTLIGGIAVAIYFAQKYIVREGEKNWPQAVVGYASAILGTIVLFPAHLELGFTVLAVLAFGDGMATLGGKLLGGPAIPWNRNKTWAGLTSFILCAGLMSSLIYWGEARPHVSWTTAALCGVIPTLFAAFAETLPVRLNDNVRVGVVAAATAVCVHAAFVGL